MARGGSLLWWVTAVILHRMITGSPLTVYNCWRPRESWSTNKPRDKQQHADENDSTTGVKVFRAQSRLRRKPVQSATTCLTSVYFGSWSCSGADDYSVTGRQASEGRLRQSRTIICWEAAVRGVYDGLREHPGGTSRLTLRLRSCHQGERAKGFAQRIGLLEKWEKCFANTAFTRAPISGCDFALYSVKCQGTNLQLAKVLLFSKKKNPLEMRNLSRGHWKSISKKRIKYSISLSWVFLSWVGIGGCAATATHNLGWEHCGVICANDWLLVILQN